MKKMYLVSLIMIALAAIIFFNINKDMSSYATFEMAENGQRVKIVGDLAKDMDIEYNPNVDAETFKFFMKDSDGKTKQVILQQAKPQDFERAESIVVTGVMKDDAFVADEILMKCPSKYKEEELSLKAEIG